MDASKFYVLRLEGELDALQYLKKRITLSWFTNRTLNVLTYDVQEPRRFMQGMIDALRLSDKIRVVAGRFFEV